MCKKFYPIQQNKMLKKILFTVGIIWTVATFSMIFMSYANNNQTQSDQEKVNNIFDFIQVSGYDNGREYDKDIETLQRIKQKEVDNLTYEQTVKYIKWEKVDDLFLQRIDETITMATAKKKALEKPAYLAIDSTNVVKSTDSQSTKDLVFQHLLQ